MICLEFRLIQKHKRLCLYFAYTRATEMSDNHPVGVFLFFAGFLSQYDYMM